MDYIEVEDRLFEFTVLAEAPGDDMSVECFDMHVSEGGLIGTIRVGPDGRGGITITAPVLIEVLRRWLETAENGAGLRTLVVDRV